MTVRNKRILWLGAAAVLIVGVGVLIKWPRLWSILVRWRTFLPSPVADEPVESDGSYRNVIFLHHSTGANLIAQGDVRRLFAERGYQFWDHGYNYQGVVRPDETSVGASYRIPGNLNRGNTDVDGLAVLFQQPVTDPPSNAFSRLLRHEVIAFKSCFPNSAIKDAAMQEQFQAWYLEMRDVFDAHPDRIFILVTSPPLHPLATNPDEAARARAIANWLKSDEYLVGHSNVFVFDFFDLLADPGTNMLSAEYQPSPDESDSHPNRQANEIIGPLFVEFVDQAVKTYQAEKGSAMP
jgi:hypothetical protein